MRRFVGLLLLLALFSGAVSGCLLPEEETVPEIRLVRDSGEEGDPVAEVRRGDLQRTYACSATYVPTATESVAFSVEGAMISDVFVKVGDEVTAGTLLAQLDCEALERDLDQLRFQAAGYSLQLAELDEEYETRKAALQLELDAAETEEARNAAEAAIAAAADSYGVQRRILELRWWKADEAIEEKEAAVEERRIYAGIDGEITYLQQEVPGGISNAAAFAVISDDRVSAFQIPGRDAAYYPAGAIVSFNCGGEIYEGRVAAAGEIQGEDDGTVYVIPTDETVSFRASDRARITILLDERTDVLIIPGDAIRQFNGQSYVYVVDENGIREMRNVEPGFVGDGLETEILSGLEEGELVVVVK